MISGPLELRETSRQKACQKPIGANSSKFGRLDSRVFHLAIHVQELNCNIDCLIVVRPLESYDMTASLSKAQL